MNASKVFVICLITILIQTAHTNAKLFDNNRNKTTMNKNTDATSGNFTLENSLFLNGDDSIVWIEAIGFDQDENIYLAGEIQGNFSLGGPTYLYYPDGIAFVAKFDSSSNYAWRVIMESTGNYNIWNSYTTPEGYTAVVGSFTGTMSFPNGDCSTTGYSDADLFLILFYANGTEAWHKCIGSTGNDGSGTAVAIGDDNNVYTIGGYWDTINLGGSDLGENGTRSSYVAKYSLEGDHMWSVSYPTGGEVWAIAKDNYQDDAVVAVVQFQGSLMLNGNNVSSNGHSHSLILKLSGTDGSYIWHQAFGNPDSDCVPHGVSVDTEGSVLASGMLDGNCTVGSVEFTGPSGAYLLKISSDGTPVWGYQYGGGLNYAMGPVNAGYQNTIFVTGYPDDNMSLGGDTISSKTGYFAAFNSDGEFLWQNTFTATEDLYIWGLHTRPEVKTLAWGPCFIGNITIDGMEYSSEYQGAFVHTYKLEGFTSEDSSDDSWLTTGALIGIIIGGVVLVGAIAGLIAYLVIKRTKGADIEMN